MRSSPLPPLLTRLAQPRILIFEAKAFRGWRCALRLQPAAGIGNLRLEVYFVMGTEIELPVCRSFFKVEFPNEIHGLQIEMQSFLEA